MGRSGKKKQRYKSDWRQDFKDMFGSVLNVLVSFYMFLVIVVMPFYFTDGYARIGTNKYEFMYNVSTKMGLIVAAVIVVYAAFFLAVYVQKPDRERTWRDFLKRISLTDWFAIAYTAAVVLSYLCSEYKENSGVGDAWKGANGWYMGLVSQLIFVAVYFVVSRFWKRQKWLPRLWFPVTFVLFVLAYLNRFEVRPIEMKNATPEFLATIGNMNWYCGYMIMLFSGMFYYIWANREKKQWAQLAAGIWLTAGFASLLTQGSQSGILALGVVLIVLYFMAVKSAEALQTLWNCLLCMGIACLGTYILRSIFEEQYNYEDGISKLLTFSPLAVVIFAVTVALCVGTWYLRKKEKLSLKVFAIIGEVGCNVLICAVIGFLALGIINTKNPGSIGALSEIPAFTFNYDWGSYRGATWAAGVMCFQDQDLLGKLVGLGPDAMVNYIHSGTNVEMLEMVKEYFRHLNLTNAHCEWLTMLVNTGILGMVSYAGLMVSAMVRFVKARRAQPMVGACGFAVLAYTVNNMVSFQQAMSTLTVFLVLGMGEAYLRGSNQGEEIT